MIQSMLDLEIMNAKSPDLQTSIQAVNNRIRTFADLYSMFDFSDDNINDIKMDEFLESIIETLKKAYKPGEYKLEYGVNIEKIILPADEAASWGLILNELITNAYKYAFNLGGRYLIDVSFKRSGSGMRLKVGNNGNVLPDDFGSSSAGGLGTELVKVLANQLNGEFIYSSNEETTEFQIITEYKMKEE